MKTLKQIVMIHLLSKKNLICKKCRIEIVCLCDNRDIEGGKYLGN